MPVQRTSGTAGPPVPCSTSSAGRSCTCVDKRLLQELQTALELVVGDRQRGQQAHDVAVRAAAEQEQPALEGGARDRGRELRILLDELERAHRPESAMLADLGDTGGQLVEAALERRAEGVGTGPEPGS